MLRVISRSSADIQPVFDAILERAVRVCDAVGGGICRWDGHKLHHVAVRWTKPKPAFAELLMRTPIQPNPKINVGRMVTTRTLVHVPDLAAELAYMEQREPGIVAAVEIGRVRTLLAVPMLKEKPDSERCLAHDHLSINTSLRTSTTSTFMNEWSPTRYLARSMWSPWR